MAPLESGDGNVDTLIQCGRQIPSKASPLETAILFEHFDCAALLLKKGANPNLPDSRGERPLHYAISRGRSEVPEAVRAKTLEMLLKAGADPNLPESTKYGDTPLMAASNLGTAQLTKILLDAGAKVNGTNNFGRTALHSARDAEIARLLISAGADRHALTISGETPSQSAAREGRYEAVAELGKP
jgi:ankyrin repeat protein